MPEIPVYAETPSASAAPLIIEDVIGAVVSWHPERGWLCSVTGHHVQPCTHTAGLLPSKSSQWSQ